MSPVADVLRRPSPVDTWIGVCTGHIIKAAGTGNVDYDLSGHAGLPNLSGMEPGTWAIILDCTRRLAATGVWGSHVTGMLGFVANGGGSVSQYCCSFSMDDGVATSNTARRMSANAVSLIDGNGSPDTQATFVSFPTATTMRLNWSVSASSGWVIPYTIITGLTGAKVVNWQTPTTAVDKYVSGVGFSPDLVLSVVGDITSAAPVS